MTRFGMPTLIETKTVKECAELCRELGLDFVELNTNFPQFQPQDLNTAELKQIAEQYGISYTIHLDDNMNISDFNPLIAQAYRRTVLDTIEIAKDLNIPVLNMHMSRGAIFTLPEKKVYFFEEYIDTYLQGIVAFRDECEKAIGDSNILICVENCTGYTAFQREAIRLLLKSPVFGLTFDVGHNHCSGNADEPFILDHADRLHHMHLHDAKEKTHDHLALGDGELDIARYLTLAAEHNCSVVVETKTSASLRQSINWIKTGSPTLFH